MHGCVYYEYVVSVLVNARLRGCMCACVTACARMHSCVRACARACLCMHAILGCTWKFFRSGHLERFEFDAPSDSASQSVQTCQSSWTALTYAPGKGWAMLQCNYKERGGGGRRRWRTGSWSLALSGLSDGSLPRCSSPYPPWNAAPQRYAVSCPAPHRRSGARLNISRTGFGRANPQSSPETGSGDQAEFGTDIGAPWTWMRLDAVRSKSV